MTTTLVAGSAAIALANPRWEYQGVAVTGERVYLDLNSIEFQGRWPLASRQREWRFG
ncbi:MAG: hypothetical protein MUF49_30955 [Oculatellaceae cyanobacterium Prado106]|nr:hypothetical protein [Oculatellaceae cyanobacterium Prado106]